MAPPSRAVIRQGSRAGETGSRAGGSHYWSPPIRRAILQHPSQVPALSQSPDPAVTPFAEDDSRNPPPRTFLDRLVRRYSRLAYVVVVLCLYLLASTAMGLAAAPAIWLWEWLADWSLPLPFLLRGAVLGFATALSFFAFGFGLLVVVPIYNFVLPTRVHPFRGGYYTLRAAPWLLHNGLFYLVRFTFLPFVTLTPFGIWFLEAMGMKIGRHAFINTEYISDPQLLTIGEDAALGGSVRIFAHYGGGGNLVVSPVVIGDRATIGLAATVMGDVRVGPDATVLPHSVLLPGSRVGAGETWGGVPARRISREQMDLIKQEIRGWPTAAA
jgi:acetyltransferase-like isoleucine patch superfamily enzyme